MPDNSAGAFDYGWLGQSLRPLEHEPTWLGIGCWLFRKRAYRAVAKRVWSPFARSLRRTGW